MPSSQDIVNMGYSRKINDPAFKKYIRNTKLWSGIFALILAVISTVSFTVYGAISDEMDNPEALYIGMGIGGMFLLIAILQIIGRNRSTTWDGRIVDKKTTEKRRKIHNTGNRNDYYWQNYMVYTVVIRRDDDDKLFESSAEDDMTIYDYYQIGDRVRHHEKLNSYEKFDKTKDEIIFCNSCASLNDINDDYCFRCNCPLLK